MIGAICLSDIQVIADVLGGFAAMAGMQLVWHGKVMPRVNRPVRCLFRAIVGALGVAMVYDASVHLDYAITVSLPEVAKTCLVAAVLLTVLASGYLRSEPLPQAGRA